MMTWGVAVKPKDGEVHCGDGHLTATLGEALLCAAIDGLGHGADAACASERAIQVLASHAEEPLDTLMKRCDSELRRTRGAAMSMARLSDGQLDWLGVGNVEGTLMRHDGRREALLTRPGVVGFRMPLLRVRRLSVASGDVLIFTTDGIESFSEKVRPSESAQAIADRILSLHRKPTDDALALVVRL